MSHEAPLDCSKFRIASAFAQVKIALVSHLDMVPMGPGSLGSGLKKESCPN